MDETDPTRLTTDDWWRDPAYLERMQNKMNVLNISRPICGISIGPGWVPPVMKCLEQMKASGWVGDVTQIKEKFRGLRIYYTNRTREVDIFIDEAAAICNDICETCGKEREDKGYGMGDSDCDACRKEYKDANSR